LGSTVQNPDIDFSKYEPYHTSKSLHVYEEQYKVGNDEYRLTYVIGNNQKPLIEKLIK